MDMKVAAQLSLSGYIPIQYSNIVGTNYLAVHLAVLHRGKLLGLLRGYSYWVDVPRVYRRISWEELLQDDYGRSLYDYLSKL